MILLSVLCRMFLYVDFAEIRKKNDFALKNFKKNVLKQRFQPGKINQLPLQKNKISINSASAQELETINGIGSKTAEKIIRYREKHKFKRLEEIKKIKGIGEKKFQKIKSRIRL